MGTTLSWKVNVKMEDITSPDLILYLSCFLPVNCLLCIIIYAWGKPSFPQIREIQSTLPQMYFSKPCPLQTQEYSNMNLSTGFQMMQPRLQNLQIAAKSRFSANMLFSGRWAVLLNSFEGWLGKDCWWDCQANATGAYC